MKECRIREIAINADGTNIWFYPQICFTRIKKRFCRKPIQVESINHFYKKCSNGDIFYFEKLSNTYKYYGVYEVIAFRYLEDAKKWIEDYKENAEKEYESYWEKKYKNLGGEILGGKIHKVE